MTTRHRAGFVGATSTAMLWAIERACLRRAGLVHVLSDFSADQLWKLYAVPRERIVRIRGAAATDRFKPAPDRGAIRGELGLSADRPIVLTVRNLEARMGLDNLLGAMAVLKARCPSALLLIGGAGSLRGALEAQSQALGLEAHVKFLGFVPDAELPRYYQAADVFVLPTRELEGFGLVTVEALACGTPVLGTPVGATPEILRARCPTCRSSLSMELPTAVELQHTYETEYPRLFAPEQVTPERTRLFGSLLDRLAALGQAPDERPRLIDVGCGGGHLAALARRRRWLALSTDIAHPACAVAGRGGETPAIQADGALLPFRGATADMVTLVNVVDQAHEPLTILREAHRVLVAGGLLALRVPNARFHRPCARLLISLCPLVRSRGWDTYPVVHHFAFTPSGLRRLVERAGFRVLEVSNSAPASREPVAKHAAVGTLPRWGRATIAAGAAALAELSRDRWLVGPSLELYARKGPR